MTHRCGTCGRDSLPDGDCHGCEAAGLKAEVTTWRAHVGALAGALDELLQAYRDAPFNVARQARAALARLPAQALAERQALEACGVELKRIRDATRYLHVHPVINDEPRPSCSLCDTVAVLDAARREGKGDGR